ncbi:MAG: AMP-binding protein [Candidatus Heimdallarchaeaceae archaeon]
MSDSKWLNIKETTIKYPEASIYEIFLNVTERDLDKIVIEQGKESYTPRQLIEYSNKLADYFLSENIQPQDTISVLLPNTIWFVVSVFASFQVGAKVTLINPRLSLKEIEFQIIDSETKILITNESFCELISNIPEHYKLLSSILTPDSKCKIESSSGNKIMYMENIFKQEDIFTGIISNSEDIAFLLYSGGTTGLAKGVMLTHFNMIANAYQFNHWASSIPREYSNGVLSSLPLCHSFGLQCGFFAPLFRGEKIIILPKFHPTDVLKIIEEKEASSFYGVPTMYIAILRQKIEDFNLSSLKICVSGGSALPEEIHHSFEEKTGISIVEGYGLTECSPVTHINPYGKTKTNSIGVPLVDTQVRIIGSQSIEQLETGDVGELTIKGPQVMKGYWGKGLESVNVFTPDGWLRTGDLGKADDEDYYFLVDRLKDIINSGGLKIYPREIEEVLFKHPAILVAAVIPIPDEYFGEVPKAFIVAKEGHDLTTEEVQDFCNEQLSRYKVPKYYEIIDELPLSAAGKVLKRELLERLSSED